MFQASNDFVLSSSIEKFVIRPKKREICKSVIGLDDSKSHIIREPVKRMVKFGLRIELFYVLYLTTHYL